MPSLINDPATLYEKAWGKQWPQHRGTILREDVIPAGQPIDSNTTYLDIPERFDYVCLDEMSQIERALTLTTLVRDALVVRDEYVKLRAAMEGISRGYRRTVGIAVTGQEGIGKTAFLLYLLLHRLENKLPTAVQFSSHRYTIFDEEGAKTVTLHKSDRRLEQCWALVDSNADVTQPCEAFRSTAQIVIQATSEKLSAFKGWVKQLRGTCVVSDLPNVLEIAAILKEHKLEPRCAFPLVNKWGPSTRTILSLAQTSDISTAEEDLAWDAMATAQSICANPLPSATFKQDLLFARPHRPFGLESIASSELNTFFIPTPHLSRIFDTCCAELSNEQSLQLFPNFSSHRLTRQTASWCYEMGMHRRLCSGGEALSVCRANSAGTDLMYPSTHLLPGTATGLEKAVLNTPFYWVPTVTSLPGVDGVLGDAEGNIYIVRATIGANDYTSPLRGLETVWEMVGQTLRDGGHWNFVAVSDTASTVDRLVTEYSDELRGVTFGRQGVSMEVRGCVLPM